MCIANRFEILLFWYQFFWYKIGALLIENIVLKKGSWYGKPSGLKGATICKGKDSKDRQSFWYRGSSYNKIVI